MSNHRLALTVLSSLVALVGCSTPGSAPQAFELPAYGAMGTAQVFQGMGSHTREVTTASAEAQDYFNQGLAWLHSFNHDEAVHSFSRATELDPGCAMAWWGLAYAQGPNYNDPFMTANRSTAAWDALQRAMVELDDETPVEAALIQALSQRYSNPPPKDRTHLEQGFADAMGDLWAKHPGDSDIGTLYAEALMVQNPWDLYTPDRRPARADTATIVGVLEQVLVLDPANPGANHLYIHAVEPSDDKDRGIAAADRLSRLVPGSGHLRHMPSHIYVQVGLWDRSIEQNVKAMASDAEYRRLAPEQGMQHGYMTHNTHMLAFSAMMVGREQEALNAARAMWDDLPDEVLRNFGPFFDAEMCSIYDVLKRFGRWDELLAEPMPPKYLPTTTAVWRAHRAVAFAAKQDFENAEREFEAFRAAVDAVPETPMQDAHRTAMKFLTVSDLFVRGEIALQRGKWDEAAELLEQAVVVEDSIGYGEPPLWLQPVRHTLGAVYLKSGRFADAERVYREDLDQWRDNGWSLYGLSRALEEQGDAAGARLTREAFDRVWAQADEPTLTSCKCIPKT
jgi:tetratricopeptide (TPR) repeat protein